MFASVLATPTTLVRRAHQEAVGGFVARDLKGAEQQRAKLTFSRPLAAG